VVAIKSLVASALLALALGPVAVADSPTLKLDPGDQAWAAQALLRASDFGLGWRGGMTKPGKPKGVSCPGFDPKASDLIVSGHANATFLNERAGVQVSVDTEVLDSPESVAKDFARTIQPELEDCLAHQLKRGPGIAGVTVERLDFPMVGANTAAYRATITVRLNGRTAKVLSDYVFFSNGRLEYSLNVQASARYRPQLVPFEADIARMLLKRGARGE
jgi:hypothetical protein